MNLDKKGFTLVEVLAVIVILAILMVIMVPSVNHLINMNKENSLKSLKNGFLNSAKTYVSDYRYEIKIDNLPCASSDEVKDILSIEDNNLTNSQFSLQTLIGKKYLKAPNGVIKNPMADGNLDVERIFVKVQYSCKSKDYLYSINDTSGSGLDWNK